MNTNPIRPGEAATGHHLPHGRATGSQLRRSLHRTVRVGVAAALLAAGCTLTVLVVLPSTADAAVAAPVVLAVESIQQVVDNIRLWLMGILASWATLCLTVGFLRYSSGEPGEVEKGKVAFRSAVIGYAGALLAPLLVTIVSGWVA